MRGMNINAVIISQRNRSHEATKPSDKLGE